MKSTWKRTVVLWIGKAMLAGGIAFFILNVITRFYYYIPWNIECEFGATDYRFPSGFDGVNGVEGFVSIHLDENGYNNKTIPDTINVLCMGSSNTLAYCVEPGKGYPALLNEYLTRDGKTAYNIGMFSHSWLNCTGNLENALEKFKPEDYVVVESLQEKYDIEKLEELLEGELKELDGVASKKMQLIKRFPYLQLIGHQVKLMRSNTIDNEVVKEKNVEEEPSEKYIDIMDKVFEKIYKQMSEYGCNYVFLYNPQCVEVDENGKAYIEYDEKYLAVFREMCAKYNFIFLDMSQYYLDAYNKEFILTSGFYNTKMGYGHINKEGHRIIAEALRKNIMEE